MPSAIVRTPRALLPLVRTPRRNEALHDRSSTYCPRRTITAAGPLLHIENADNVLRSKLKEHMPYCMDHPDEISKLAKVQAQVSEVKGVMMENIEKVAIIFKHQQTVSKSHEAQVTRLDEKINELKAQMKELEVDLTKAKMGEPLGKAADGKLKKNVVPELLEKRIILVDDKIDKIELTPPTLIFVSEIMEDSTTGCVDFMIYEEEILEDWKLQVMKPPRHCSSRESTDEEASCYSATKISCSSWCATKDIWYW
ncbi:hypothetical protein IEQ34_014127 [Dendrobium chrysotoxum]|uniref:DNA topoisomerase I catalytic core eukaryotic-type domain-containing protein n=1 Tax=Dendrobium chrysotoxum TaxID=161865 RepID=A0AAV7GJ42_DENCH|nr:hypothetical protein IEQ34_014127 [Dendrobium chrysotoxum]